MSRVYVVGTSHSRIIITAFSEGGLHLFHADFSLTELDAAVSFLRQELSEEIAREEVRVE